MVTLIVALTAGAGGFLAAKFAADAGIGWCVTWGLLAFVVVQVVANLIIQKRVKRDMEAVQGILVAGQKKLQAKVNLWQFRPPGSMQAAQREILAETRVFVQEALAQVERLARYRPWVPMMDRQIATAKVQLSWMVKDFKTVDALMPKAILLDPTMAAIKMARLYMLDRPSEEIGKVYAKAVRRMRYNQNVLLAAAWSWMLVKRGDVDGAFKALTEALRKSDNAVLRQNHETLMNNRVAHFTNAGLGDQWYSLLLEEPRLRQERQRSVYR